MAWYNSIDTVKKFPLGVIKQDVSGNRYAYASGIASTAAGSWVTFGVGNTTALLVSGASGPVGVSMSANIVATTFGWYQVYGSNTIALGSSNGTFVSGGGQLQANASGVIAAQGTSVGSAAGDYVFGAYCYSALDTTAATDAISVFLNFPFTATAAAVPSS